MESDFELKLLAKLNFLTNVVRNSYKRPVLNPKWDSKWPLRDTRMGDLWGKFPQVSHSPTEGHLGFIEPPHFGCHGLCF